MLNIFKVYKGISLPPDPLLLARKVLSHQEDKELQEFFWFFLALNADRIDGKKICEKLDKRLRPLFREGYNRAYLLLQTWSKLVSFTTRKKLSLPNLFLPKKAENYPFFFYKAVFNDSRKRLEKRWREILSLY